MEQEQVQASPGSQGSANKFNEETNLLNILENEKNQINQQYINDNGNREQINLDSQANQNFDEINIILDINQNGETFTQNNLVDEHTIVDSKPLLQIQDKQINDSENDLNQKLSNFSAENKDLIIKSQTNSNVSSPQNNTQAQEVTVQQNDALHNISHLAPENDEFIIILSLQKQQEDNSKNEIKFDQNEANLDQKMKQQYEEKESENDMENMRCTDLDMIDESQTKLLENQKNQYLNKINSQNEKKTQGTLRSYADNDKKFSEVTILIQNKSFDQKIDNNKNKWTPPTEDFNEQKRQQNQKIEQMDKQNSDANQSSSTVRHSNMRTRYNGQKKVVAESQLLQNQEIDSANLNNKKKKQQKPENEGSILNPELSKPSNLNKSKSNKQLNSNEIDSGLTNDKDIDISQKNKNESFESSQNDQFFVDQGLNKSGDLSKKFKKNNNNQFEQCKKLYKKMFQFYWDLKEFTSGRHSPKDDLTAGAFWFYMNTTYFPHNMFDILTDISEEEFIKQVHFMIQKRIVHTHLNSQQESNLQNQIQINFDSNQNLINNQIDQQDQIDQSVEQNGQIIENVNEDSEEKKQNVDQAIQSLVSKRKKYMRFKKHFNQLIYRVQNKHSFYFEDDQLMKSIKDQANAIPRNPIVYPFQIDSNKQASPTNFEQTSLLDPEKEILEIKKNMMFENFQKVLYLAEKDLDKLTLDNETTLKNLFNQTKQKYQNALEIPLDSDEFKDKTIYKPQEIHKYPQSFVSFVDPFFVQDMVKNKEWYLENTNQFMLNINYPSKLQNDYLKELALAQQRRNDQRYKKIMQQMQEIVDSDEMQMQFQLQLRDFNQKQREIVQDDACCAICSSGDYEDDDQIVFCSRCSIPVHQSCFGLEKIPENDWICNNCYTFGFQRGLMVKCFLCPKRGGAMKPTNVFRSHEKYFEKKVKNIPKKSGKLNIEKLNNIAQNQQPTDLSEDQEEQKQNQVENQSCSKQSNINIQVFKQQILSRLENNCCLAELITREQSYYKDVMNQKIDQTDNSPLNDKKINDIAKLQLQNKIQDEFQLNYNKNEQNNHQIPEDFRDFISRNEAKLESPNTPITDSLYYWAHHSCSMWTQGPQVTPKTPVKMNKLDFSKFQIGCVICGQKGINVGASVKCFKQDCQIYFHVECAKRANYCMEIEKKVQKNQKEKIFKIFCESHRPFKIIQEINEQNAKEIEDIQKFMKTIEKCYEVYQKWLQKPKKLLSKTERNKMVRQALQIRKSELVLIKKSQSKQGRPRKEKKEEDVKKKKKWKEKDKRILLDRVKEKYLQVKKMRFNMQKIDPMVQETKRYLKEKKRIKKLEEKRKKAEQNIIQNQEFKRVIIENEMKRKERGLRGRVRIEQDNIFDQQQQFQERDNNNFADLQNANFNNSSNTFYNELNDTSDNLIDFGENELKLIKFKIEQDQKEIEQIDEIMPNPPILNQIPEYFEAATPLIIRELEWKVTLSRYDFPWQEIAFSTFSSKECYKMYTSIVTDAQSFLVKVLGNKPKYQKMIKNQLEGLPTIDQIMNMQFQQKGQYQQENPNMHHNNYQNYQYYQNKNVQFVTSRIEDNMNPGGDFQYQGFQGQNQQILISSQQTTLYCRCKGKVISDLMVGCETGEDACPNKGWLHPQCCDDLKDLSVEEIDKVDQWYCPDCIYIKQCNNYNNNFTPSQCNDVQMNSQHIYTQPTQPKHSQNSLNLLFKPQSPINSNNQKSRKSFIIKLGQDQQIIELEIDSQKNKKSSSKYMPEDEISLNASEEIEDIDLYQQQNKISKDSQLTQKTDTLKKQNADVKRFTSDHQIKQDAEHQSIFQQVEQSKNNQNHKEVIKQIESQFNDKKKKVSKKIPDMFNLHQINSQQNIISFHDKNKQNQEKPIMMQQKYLQPQNNYHHQNHQQQNQDNQKKLMEQILCQLIDGADKQNESLDQLLNDPQLYNKISQGLSNKDQEQEKQQYRNLQMISDYIQSLIDQQDQAKKQQEQMQQKEIFNRQQRQQQLQQQSAMQTLSQIIGLFGAQNNQQKPFNTSPINPINLNINTNQNNFNIQQPQFSRPQKQTINNQIGCQIQESQGQTQNIMQIIRMIEQNNKDTNNQQKQHNLLQQQEQISMIQKLISLQNQSEQLQSNRPQLLNTNLNNQFVQQQLNVINDQQNMSSRQMNNSHHGSQRVHSQSQNTQRQILNNQQEEQEYEFDHEQIQLFLSQLSNIQK